MTAFTLSFCLLMYEMPLRYCDYNLLPKHIETLDPSHATQCHPKNTCFRSHSLYEYATLVVVVALVAVVNGRFIGSWHVPEKLPVVMQMYPAQQERVATLHDTREIPSEPIWSTADKFEVEKTCRSENLRPAGVQACRGAANLTPISTEILETMA